MSVWTIGGLLLASAVSQALPRFQSPAGKQRSGKAAGDKAGGDKAAGDAPPRDTQAKSGSDVPTKSERDHTHEVGSAPVTKARSGGNTEVKKETIIQIAKNVFVRIGKDNLMLVAAGCAFYGMTAIFPAIAAFVSVYGLFADPHTAQSQIASFSTLLPPEALKILNDALQTNVNKNQSTLNIALLVSLGLALYAAKAGVSALMTGLNIVNEEEERRGFFTLQFIGLALTVAGVLFAVLAIAAVAVLPAIIQILPVGDTIKSALEYGRWPVLAIVVMLALAIFYRFGASRESSRWRWVTWGAGFTTVLWLISSAGFSYYVSNFSSYDKTYGSLAAPIILLLWFWVSALVVLLGAEIDAELEYADGRRARPVKDAGA